MYQSPVCTFNVNKLSMQWEYNINNMLLSEAYIGEKFVGEPTASEQFIVWTICQWTSCRWMICGVNK